METKKPTETEKDIRNVDVPEGYVFEHVPKSKIEAISKEVFGYDKLIVRSAIEAYVRRWFDTEGINRKVFGDVVPPSINYVTDKDFDQTADPISKRVLLARVFSELRQHVPAILISDTGAEYKSSGLGDYSGGYFDRDLQKHVLKLNTNADINIEIVIISQDEETTQVLYSLLLHVFGSARRLGLGNHLTPRDPGHKWVVRLPLQFSQAGVQQQGVTDDPKDQFWTGSISMVVQYESVKAVAYSNVLPFNPWDKRTRELDDEGNFKVAVDFDIDDPDIFDKYKPEIVSPSKMRVNQPQFAVIERMLRVYVVYIDKPAIATVHPESFMITPRRPGTFKLVIGKRSADNGKIEVITSKEIEVVL